MLYQAITLYFIITLDNKLITPTLKRKSENKNNLFHIVNDYYLIFNLEPLALNSSACLCSALSICFFISMQ